MRKAIHHTVIPDGKVWIPKPPKTHYSYMDWLVRYQQWQMYVGIIKIEHGI